ncbi:MAG: phosphatase PAP2 family protein [Verrucomicrobiae bacterium]|nr:phosphatase PAP2 family protein [Verrucomicrobiae bacterium]
MPLILGVVFSLWLTSGDRELAFQKSVFDSESGEWLIGQRPFWRFLYEFASLPVLAVCTAAIVVLMLSFRRPAVRAWRRVAWYSLAMLVLGPGLIANLWMKDNWGRPRPREISEFGGRSLYERVFELDFVGAGKSFPCGHATMGFYFLGAYFLLRRRFPGWSLVVLVAALLWGGLIGYTRMLQGGHFATDVVWAAVVMWLSGAILFRVFRLNRQVLDPPKSSDAGTAQKIPWWAKVGAAVAVIAVVIGLSLATPYRAVRHLIPVEKAADVAEIKGSITLSLGSIDIVPAEGLTIDGEAWGHGVPTSQIAERWEESTETDGIWRFKYFQRISGRFTEIAQDLTIGMPWDRVEFLKLDLGPGETRMTLPVGPEPVKIELFLNETELIITIDPEARVVFDATEFPVEVKDESQGQFLTEALARDWTGSIYQFAVAGNDRGTVIIRTVDKEPPVSPP